MLAAAEDAGIIHGGIKPEHILVKDGEKGGIVKINNFGLGQVHDTPGDIEHVYQNLLYLPPEALIQGRFNEKVDIWSLGATIYEACTLEGPIFDEEGATDYRKAVIKNIRTKKPVAIDTQKYSIELEKLLRNMLDKDAIFRPTARHILKMPLIRLHRAQQIGMVDEQMIDAKEKERLTKLRNGGRIFRVVEGSLLT